MPKLYMCCPLLALIYASSSDSSSSSSSDASVSGGVYVHWSKLRSLNMPRLRAYSSSVDSSEVEAASSRCLAGAGEGEGEAEHALCVPSLLLRRLCGGCAAAPSSSESLASLMMELSDSASLSESLDSASLSSCVKSSSSSSCERAQGQRAWVPGM